MLDFTLNFDLLRRLCEATGVSGRESQVRELVQAEMEPLVDEITTDALGNLIGTKKGSGGPRVMLAAHMDEIGFLVRYIDDRGFLRLQAVGGWDPRTLVAQRVHVHGYGGQVLLGAVMPAAKPIHLLTPEDLGKTLKLEEMFVDLGMPVEEVKAQVEIGDMVTMARTAERLGDCIVSKSLDDRISVFIMLEALRILGPCQSEIIAVATTQEEVGLRGAGTAAYGIAPDIAVALDVTLANDFPGSPDTEQVSRLGEGCAISIMDGATISPPALVRHFRDVAEAHSIPHQLSILSRGGTDAGAMQRARTGAPAFTLSTPTRYLHTVNETAHLGDVQAAVTLLARYLEDSHTRQYR